MIEAQRLTKRYGHTVGCSSVLAPRGMSEASLTTGLDAGNRRRGP